MSEDCIFCQIINGEIPSNTVAETETAYAFLDVNPLARGHTLVIPKAHHERVGDMPAETAGDVFELVNEITPAVEDAVDAPASTVAFNNGEDAGQEVPHVHCHIVPRFAEDGGKPIHSLFTGADVPDEEMGEIAEAIRDAQ
ncbi:HIT family protein [Salinibaculum rarum]|uniref:HIT family protein n=1 Tax=Salinibaculum rarum TaxID=3058903 RepID=UPI00265F0BC1|nr:HIT family protein [Salinibaculum sp. KK48]